MSLIALHFHWCVADAARQSSSVETKSFAGWAAPELPALMQASAIMYKTSLWFALLHVVIEGYKQLRICEPLVDALLKEESMVDSLRRFRNAIFHYQETPFGPKQQEFLAHPHSFEWATKLHRELGSAMDRNRSRDFTSTP